MKRIFSSRTAVLGMALCLIISILGTSIVPQGKVFAAESGQNATAASAAAAVKAAVVKVAAESVLSRGIGSDWQAIALARGGYELPASYITTLASDVEAAKGTYRNVTEYARRVLAATAAGADATNLAGHNLIEKIYNNEKMTSQGINGVAYSLLALDAGKYNVPDNAQWTRDKLVSYLLSKQNTDGGFTLTTGASDTDVTAIVLTALSAHTGQAAVKSAGDRAIEWLSLKQQSHGGYGDSSESVAQAIIALTANGADPVGARFTKDGHNLVSRLLSFRTTDGGFSHTLSGSYDGLSTEQALQALVAYGLFAKGGKFYSFTEPVQPVGKVPQNQPAQPVEQAEPSGAAAASIVIAGPEGLLAEGTVQTSNALEALKKLAAEKKIDLEMASFSGGSYVAGIQGIKSGIYGGYDGWNYIVSRQGDWVYPSVGMSDFKLEAADQMMVYYGDTETQIVQSVTAQPAKPKADEAFTVKVVQGTQDWKSGKVLTSPAANVQVQVGTQIVSTDAQGKATFPAGSAGDGQSLTVTGYREGKTPSILSFTQLLSELPLFEDQKQISAWAASSVESAYEKGFMEGVSSSGLRFAPKDNITRAQFAALLVRLTGNTPSAASTTSVFSDVKPEAWYYGYVLKAKELGIIDGVNTTSFKPGGVITRQDMAVMIARAYKLEGSSSVQKFTDEGKISNYALIAVRSVSGAGYMTGFNGAFEPAAPVTREMAAVVAVRLP